MVELPDTLASSAARPPGVRAARQRRARSNVRGRRAEILPSVKPGEKVWQLVPDNAALREYGRRRGFEVKDHGPVRRAVRDAYAKENAWTVRIVSLQTPRDSQAREYFEVMQGPYIRRRTRDWFYVARTMGDELFAQLKEVTP